MNLTLADHVDAVLPQTQCTKCGYQGCRPYAEAIASRDAAINQCPPGGAAGIEKLAALLGRAVVALNPVNGVEAPLSVALIDEALCIGCTLCIQACPVDAIVGAARRMHTVLPENCSGCDLCIAPCPMDCIRMVDAGRRWNDADASAARHRHDARRRRLASERIDRDARLEARALAKLDQLDERDDLQAAEIQRKKAVVQAAIQRARARRAPRNPAAPGG